MAITKIRKSQVKGLEDQLNQIYNQIKTYKEPVALVADLPLENNNDGDTRVCLENKNIYIWDTTTSEWILSSSKDNVTISNVLTKNKLIDITNSNQTTINTGIRFDGTGDYITNTEVIMLYVNGIYQSPSNYTVSRVDEELVITWASSEQLILGDKLDILFYDASTLINGGGSGSSYVHPSTHPASMIIFQDGENLEDKISNGDAIQEIESLSNDLAVGFYYLKEGNIKYPISIISDPDNSYKKLAIKITQDGVDITNISTQTVTSYKHSNIISGTVGLRNGNKYIILTDNNDDEILIDVSSIETGGGTYNVMFTTTKPINNPIGGFKLGDVVTESDAMSLNDALNKILYKDIAPSFDFSATGSGLVETGNIIASPTYSCRITDIGTGTISSIVFYKNNTVVSTQTYSSSSDLYTYEDQNITSTTTIRCTVIYRFTGDTQNRYVSKDLSYNFVSASYYGIIDENTFTEDKISSLNKTIKTTKSLTYNGINMQNQYVCYLYPTIYGDLTSIIDGNNFQYIDSFNFTRVDISGVQYNVYVLMDSATYDNGKLTFN